MRIMNCSEDETEYQTIYWPNLRNMIYLFLTNSAGINQKVSFEEMYSYVYKCVCKQMADRLHKDLYGLIHEHLREVEAKLRNAGTSHEYIVNLNTEIDVYIQGVELIARIFTYMNRFYVESRMQTDLKTGLLQQFNLIVIGPAPRKLIAVLEETQSVPFAIPPQLMANIVKNLHFLNPDLAQSSPNVFARFIPNILPPMDMEEIPNYIAETRRTQQELVLQGFQSGTNNRKRTGRDEDGS